MVKRLALCSVFVALFGASAFFVAGAHAQDWVEEGAARYMNADFDGALEALEQAEQSGDLTRSSLVRLLFTRALTLFALGRSEALQETLVQLVSLEPQYEAGPEVAPGIREALQNAQQQSKGVLEVLVPQESVPGGVRFRALVVHDPGRLTEEVELAARVQGEPWQRTDEGALSVPVPAGEAVEYYARALGPSDVELAARGSAQAPLRMTLLAEQRAVLTSQPTSESVMPMRDETSSDSSAVAWLSIAGAGLAVAGAVTWALLTALNQTSDETRVEPPRLVPP